MWLNVLTGAMFSVHNTAIYSLIRMWLGTIKLLGQLLYAIIRSQQHKYMLVCQVATLLEIVLSLLHSVWRWELYFYGRARYAWA